MASEIRVDKINSLSGVGTVTLSPTGVEIAGITTVATLKATTGIVTTLTATGSAKVGSGITLSPDGDIFTTGVSTSSLLTSLGQSHLIGAVGIGTTIPQSSAHIYSTNPVLRLTDYNQAADNKNWNIAAGTDNILRIQAINDSDAGGGNLFDFYRVAEQVNEFRGTNSGSTWFVVDNLNQRVGIGTSIPATILHVQANVGDMLRLDRQSNAGGTGNQIAFRHNNATGTPTETGSINCVITANADTGQLRFYTKESGGSNTEKLRILPAGGITFNGDSANANALDDYEEGDWTPTFDTSAAGGSITVNSYNVQYGKYVKIGKVVYVEGVIRGNVTNNSNGTYDLGGLPFTVANTPNASGILHGKEQSSWTVAPHHFSCISNTTRARARGGIDVGDNAYTNANTSGFNSGSATNNRIYIAGSYRVEG